MLVSVYISKNSIKVVSASYYKKSLVIHDAFRRNIPEGLIINGVITNPEMLSNELRKFFLEKNLPLENISLVISGNGVMCKTVKVPHTSHANILKIIKNEYWDIDNADNSVFDYTVIKADNIEDSNEANTDELSAEKKRRKANRTAIVLACAVSRDIISSYVNVFDSAGISLSSINTDINSEIKLMNKYRQLSDSTFMLAAISGNVLSSALFVDGTYVFANRSRLMQQRGTQECIVEMKEIVSSFIQFIKAQKNKFVSDAYFCGMNDTEMELCSYISDTLNINVNILPDCPSVISSDVPDFRLSEYIFNVGNLLKL